MYHDGKGTPINYKEALKWFKQAANLGNSSAQYNLGLMHLYGHEVFKSNIEFSIFFNIEAHTSITSSFIFKKLLNDPKVINSFFLKGVSFSNLP